MLQKIKKAFNILNKKEQKKLIFLLMGIIVLGFSEILGIGLIIPMINFFINPEYLQHEYILKIKTFLGLDEAELLLLVVVGGSILFLSKMVYAIVISYWQANINAGINVRLGRDVLEAYLKKKYSFHLKNNSSVLLRNLNSEIVLFCYNFINPLISVFVEVCIIFSVLFVLFLVYPLPTLVAVLFAFLLGFTIYLLVSSRMKAYALQRTKYSDEYFKSSTDALNGIKEIQIYGKKDYFINRFYRSFWLYYKSHIKYQLAYSFPKYLIEATVLIAFLILIFFTISYQYKSQDILPILASLGVASVRILPSIVFINQNLSGAQYYAQSVEIVHDIVKDTSQESTTVQSKVAEQNAKISTEQVDFGYDDKKLFTQLSLKILPHQTTALVGESGSGKSTFVDLLMGLLEPQNGQILYGNTPITEENISSFRQKIGYVPQQIFLYDATLAENIAFGVPIEEIDLQILEKAIKQAQLSEVVQSFHEGINTQIGDKGIRLSGGQRQRVGIARALYRQPEILIFDEATAALDNNTEVEVNKAIKNLQKNVTIILVAHRLQTIQQADYIYVLDKGKIVDEGKFEYLSQNSPTFKHITYLNKVQ